MEGIFYIDSSVIIGAYHLSDPHHKRCEEFMRDLSLGKYKGVISIFGLAEIAGFISRNASAKDAKALLELLPFIPNLEVAHAFARVPSERLLELCTERGLSGSDALHVIHAQSFSGVHTVVTLDRDFLKVGDLLEVIVLT